MYAPLAVNGKHPVWVPAELILKAPNGEVYHQSGSCPDGGSVESRHEMIMILWKFQEELMATQGLEAEAPIKGLISMNKHKGFSQYCNFSFF